MLYDRDGESKAKTNLMARRKIIESDEKYYF